MTPTLLHIAIILTTTAPLQAGGQTDRFVVFNPQLAAPTSSFDWTDLLHPALTLAGMIVVGFIIYNAVLKGQTTAAENQAAITERQIKARANEEDERLRRKNTKSGLNQERS